MIPERTQAIASKNRANLDSIFFNTTTNFSKRQ